MAFGKHVHHLSAPFTTALGCATPAGITCPTAKWSRQRQLRILQSALQNLATDLADSTVLTPCPVIIILSPFSRETPTSSQEDFSSKYLWIVKPSGSLPVVTETQSSVFESVRFLTIHGHVAKDSGTKRSRRNALHRLGDPSGTAFATAPHQASRGLDAPASVRHPDARRRSASTWNAESPPYERAKGLIPGGRRWRRLKSTATPRRLAVVVAGEPVNKLKPGGALTISWLKYR